MIVSNEQYVRREPSLPIVSIIAICHNHAPYVKEALDSIRNQTYPNIELIIINNLKDGCESVIRQWIEDYNVNCKFVQNETPRNVNQNLNLGLSLLVGEYFQGFSCDDAMSTDKIELQIRKFMELDERYACVYGDCLQINKESEVLGLVSLRQRFNNFAIENDLSDILARAFFINAPSVLLRTKIVRLINSYNENLIIEDYYLFTKMASEGYLFFYFEAPLVKYRILDNSSSRLRSIKFYDDLIAICESVHSTIPYYKFKSNMWQSSIIQYRRAGGRIRVSHLFNYIRGTKRFSLSTIISYLFGSQIRKIFGRK